MRTGLYTPGDFKDNCGFGLIAHIEGETSHKLLETAIDSLTCMTHRGGIAADGKTGDGCGMLIQKPDSFLRAVAQEQGIILPEQYAIGMLFMDLDDAVCAEQKSALEQAMSDQGLSVLGWRTVPTNNDCLGPMAIDCLPRFEQVFIAVDQIQNTEPVSSETFGVKLFVCFDEQARQVLDAIAIEKMVFQTEFWFGLFFCFRHCCFLTG